MASKLPKRLREEIKKEKKKRISKIPLLRISGEHRKIMSKGFGVHGTKKGLRAYSRKRDKKETEKEALEKETEVTCLTSIYSI